MYLFGLATLQLSPLTGFEELHILQKTQYEGVKYRMQNQYPVCVSNTHASNRSHGLVDLRPTALAGFRAKKTCPGISYMYPPPSLKKRCLPAAQRPKKR